MPPSATELGQTAIRATQGARSSWLARLTQNLIHDHAKPLPPPPGRCVAFGKKTPRCVGQSDLFTNGPKTCGGFSPLFFFPPPPVLASSFSAHSTNAVHVPSFKIIHLTCQNNQ